MSEQVSEETSAPSSYKDDDLVYVDPESRTVVGFVEWTTTGKPKPLAMKQAVAPDNDQPSENKLKRPVRAQRLRYYPWGTYRSMKRIYKIEGKPPKVESQKTLDEVIEKALELPFWD